MHVGVFVADVKADEGGSYTFIHDVASGFVDIAEQSFHRFTLFGPPDYIAQLRKRSSPSNVDFAAVPARGLIEARLGQLKHYVPAMRHFWRRPGGLERVARARGVELMWLTGRYYDTLDIPYAATIWDVQHLTHPWFPEVSANGTWENRELSLTYHLRRASVVITGTETGRDELVHFYRLPEERVLILPHPTPAFALNVAPAVDARPPAGVAEKFVFYPAQFWAHKNHVNLLLAWRKLLDRDPDAPELVLVGSDTGNSNFVKRRTVELGLADKVRYLGFVPTDILIALYRSARMLVYPSFSGPENLPPLEGFALGCPVAASEFPGAREQLGDAALLFNPMDPESIAATVARLLTDDGLRRSLIERGHARARRWTAHDFARGIFAMADRFECQRRCWPSP